MEMQMDEVSDQFLQFVEDVFVNEPRPPGLVSFWDSTVGSVYPYVISDRVQSSLASDEWRDTFRRGTAQMIRYLACNLGQMNIILQTDEDDEIQCITFIKDTCDREEQSDMDKRDKRDFELKVTVSGTGYSGTIDSQGVGVLPLSSVDLPWIKTITCEGHAWRSFRHNGNQLQTR